MLHLSFTHFLAEHQQQSALSAEWILLLRLAVAVITYYYTATCYFNTVVLLCCVNIFQTVCLRQNSEPTLRDYDRLPHEAREEWPQLDVSPCRSVGFPASSPPNKCATSAAKRHLSNSLRDLQGCKFTTHSQPRWFLFAQFHWICNNPLVP